jgi:hypothetical protein
VIGDGDRGGTGCDEIRDGGFRYPAFLPGARRRSQHPSSSPCAKIRAKGAGLHTPCKRRHRPEHTLRTVPFLGDLRGKKTEPCRPRIRGNVTNSENGTLKVFPAKTRTIFNVFFPNWHRHAGVGFVRLGAKTKEWDTK